MIVMLSYQLWHLNLAAVFAAGSGTNTTSSINHNSCFTLSTARIPNRRKRSPRRWYIRPFYTSQETRNALRARDQTLSQNQISSRDQNTFLWSSCPPSHCGGAVPEKISRRIYTKYFSVFQEISCAQGRVVLGCAQGRVVLGCAQQYLVV